MNTNPTVTAYLNDVGLELDAVERLTAPPLNRFASFHLQQAAEKLVKAIRLHREKYASSEHRISILLDDLPPGDPWIARLTPLNDLSQFATSYRYATDAGRVKVGLDEPAIKARVAQIRALLAEARAECGG